MPTATRQRGQSPCGALAGRAAPQLPHFRGPVITLRSNSGFCLIALPQDIDPKNRNRNRSFLAVLSARVRLGRSTQSREERAQFFIDLCWAADGIGDLLPEQFAVAPAHTAYCHLESSFGAFHPESQFRIRFSRVAG